MIEIDGVTRENFDSSGLSTGYAVATKISDIESEILNLIKGAFAGIPNVPMRDIQAETVRTELLSKVSEIENRAVTLFKSSQTDIFESLNRSIQNGFTVGKKSGAMQTGKEVAESSLTENPYGKETVQQANGNLLRAESTAIIGAVSGLTAGIALLTGGFLSGSDMTFRSAYDEFVVPTFEKGLSGKNTVDGRQISLTSYAETVTRESSQKALLIGESEAANRAGIYLVQISAHYASCPLCEPWQNAVLVDDVWANGKPDGVHRLLSEAIRAGLFHYNCRHVKRIYISGKTVADNPPNYDPQKVAVNYELEQIQRRLEREIRNEKRVRDMCLTESEYEKASRIISNKQAQLRGLVQYAEDNGYKVYRQNWKEQVEFGNKPPERPYNLS